MRIKPFLAKLFYNAIARPMPSLPHWSRCNVVDPNVYQNLSCSIPSFQSGLASIICFELAVTFLKNVKDTIRMKIDEKVGFYRIFMSYIKFSLGR